MDGVGSPPELSLASGSYFTPLLIAMAGIAATALAIVVYHFFIVRYCLGWRLRSSPDSAVSNPLPDQQFPFGVEEKVLISIPILSYSSTKDDGNVITFRVDQTECVICLGELQDGDMVRLLPNCRHSFHVSCIDNWFQRHSSCPLCRSLMVEPCSNDVALSLSDERNEVVSQNLSDEGGDESPSSSGIDESSSVLPRHSVSTVLPVEGKRQRLVAGGLKRSLSMDQCYVLLNIQRENRKEEELSSSSSSSSLRNVIMESRSFKARSMKQLDRMSSRFVRSLSQLRIGRSSCESILP
ncbi:RING-H2 finger protein ATL17-like [Pistacia vera]|uniref:RING-H2 finger protein ATL17-like n=1 Tax=Pistacia vera TaxID=55513 RepID=UPI001262DC98|nr:RING-H2 finger protein ATL17-like [Pistacia vera]